jgi:hypothetical protein
MDRRAFLKTGALAGGALAVGRAAFGQDPPRPPGAGPGGMQPFVAERASDGPFAGLYTRHLVLIAFAGGVRTKETFGTPGNVPNLVQLAQEGVLFPRTRSSNLGHFGAALSIFTGISEPRGIRDNSRGPDPTLFEYCRKDAALEASDVWISTSGGAQQTNYSCSVHPDYGSRYGANTLDGDGIFNREFKQILDQYGRPRELADREQELLERMRGSIGSGVEGGGLNSRESGAKVEQYILQELTRGTVDLRGPNAGDAKALRVARNLVSIFKPRITAVVLQNADVAHGSYNAYLEVVRQNDAMIGELMTAVREDDYLRQTTSVIVLPEFGRDQDLNSRRGLDHGDGSDDLNYVACACWGPDFEKGKVVEEDVRAIDICPTICSMVGASSPLAKGRRLPGLFA